MYEKRVARAYRRELFGSITVYIVLLLASIRFGRPMAEGVLRTIVLTSPMIGFGLMIWAVTRQFGRVDEYARQLLLETLAMAAAITGALTFTYGFLETAGYPRLSMFIVWAVLGTSWGVVACVRKLTGR
jgi:hypothetical protein